MQHLEFNGNHRNQTLGYNEVPEATVADVDDVDSNGVGG